MKTPEDVDSLTHLSHKYAGNVPRYTSYPTAVELAPCSDPGPAREALRGAADAGSPLSLYVHLPYCHSLCYFCACNKIVSSRPDEKQEYLKLLRRECELLREAAGSGLRICQVHLGGGSPSFLNLDELVELESLLHSGFALQADAEKSVELDPRTTNPAQIRLLFSQGYRRASVGVQDFDPRVQQTVHRHQPYEMTREVIEVLRDAGFTGINIDLIYGLPEQQPAMFEHTLQQVLELRPDRIALYGYAHVAWKIKAQNVFKTAHLPTPEERMQLFSLGLKVFTEAGYEYIGLDHFALPDDALTHARRQGTLKRNFMGYTTVTGEGMAAIGISSIADIGGCLSQNHTGIKEYRTALELGQLPIAKLLARTPEDRVRAQLIERMMCDNILERDRLCAASPLPQLTAQIFDESLPHFARFAEDGLVAVTPATIEVTQRGRLFVRHLASVFDTYFARHSGGEKKTFSQAI